MKCDGCLEDFKIGENVIKLDCKHIFHKECLKDWLIAGKNNNCPFCQYKLTEAELYKTRLNLTIEGKGEENSSTVKP
uniref:RING-type domain-containing protein n=1 Tax=Meloidogyne incognita TaxID=6306 RepID=A0A914M2T2_MELIC